MNAVVRWKFTDLLTSQVYTFAVNPNEGGSPSISKNLAVNNPIGPNRRTVMSEGRLRIEPLQFSGVILSQGQFEVMEYWSTKRTLLQLEDDLGREFQGVFSSWNPQRARRAANPWYHTYSVTFSISAFRSASGVVLYGYFLGG